MEKRKQESSRTFEKLDSSENPNKFIFNKEIRREPLLGEF